jgi:outer membrane protein OmpA-like peptidoglycan-associated protein
MNMQEMETHNDGSLNPFIAFTDVGINLVLILTFFVAAVLSVGRAGWGGAGCVEWEKSVYHAVMREMRPELRPQHIDRAYRNDPTCVQRWRFAGKALFYPNSVKMTPEGYQSVAKFAEILGRYRGQWRRIRIEGHTAPPLPGQNDDWELSAQRAAVVARIFHSRGRIPAYHLAVSGRAGQAPWDRLSRTNPENERVEVVIEFVPAVSKQ